MLVGADSHLGLSSDNPPGNLIPLKSVDTKALYLELIIEAEKRGVPLIMAGDIFDSENPKSYAHAIFMEILNEIIKRDVVAYFIPGNHDCGSFWSALSVARATMDCTNIHIILDNPYVFNYDGLKVCLFPHLPKAKYSEVIGEYETIKGYVEATTGMSSFDVFITHALAEGTISSSETELVESGTAMLYDPNTWPSFKVGVFGHVHKQQHLILKKKSSVILIPGSMPMCDFGERKDEKGYISLKREGKTIDWKFEKYNSKVTTYKQVKIDLLTKDVFNISDEQLKKLAGCLLKVVVHTDDPVKVDEVEIRERFNKRSHVVRFERIYYDTGKTKIENDDSEVIFTGVKYDKLVKTWLDKKDNVPDDIKKLAFKFAKEVIDNAS